MQNILLHITSEDVPFLPRIKDVFAAKAKVQVKAVDNVTSSMEIVIAAGKHNTKQVISTSESLLNKLIESNRKVSLDDYAGSIIKKFGCEFLFLNPLKHTVSVPYGKFLIERYTSKFLNPAKFLQLPEFKWEVFSPERTDALIDFLFSCSFISVDIETYPAKTFSERLIECVGFTGVKFVDGGIVAYTVVVPFENEYQHAFIKIICESLIPKVFQNGKYDNAYLMRWNITVMNYAFDTANLFHCWYSELPKRLDFITSFTLRDWEFWKDEGKNTTKYDRYKYNAKDCFGTAMSFLSIVIEMPPYAVQNYMLEFPLTFPCFLAEMTGLRINKQEMDNERIRFEESLGTQLKTIRTMVGNEYFNPSSPQQTVKLFEVLGCGDIKNTTPPSRDKVSARHPINKRIVKAITDYRKDRKLVSAYLRDEDPKTKELKVWHGKIFYSLNPHGTDTGRLASKESAYWCGLQIQNIPRDRKDIQVKRIFESEPDFFFGECDREQAEARDVAYLSGDINLIKAVDDETKDFHGTNASAFFGVSYDKIVESKLDPETAKWVHKTLDKDLRDLSKRTNHGANYNMGAGVMLDTMGIENVLRAKKLLNLPANYTLLDVTSHLLSLYSKTYSTVKGAYYDKIKGDVRSKKMLVGPTGWTRYCFGKPWENKLDLNACVAHPSQSLNAMELNISFMKVFYEVWMPNPQDFRLHAQIHDSILFSYRKGREDLAWKVKECMEIETPVTDTFGIKRILKIPAALKGNATRWSEVEPLYKKAA